MSMRRAASIRVLGALLALGLLAGSLPAVALGGVAEQQPAATTLATQESPINVTFTTSYGGVDAETQAIEVTVDLSPRERTIQNISVGLRATSNTFLDTDSFETTTSPSGVGADVNYEGDGEYFIAELSPDESVVITFDVYPRTIKQQQLPVAVVAISGENLGQDTNRLSADMSDSSYFALQRAQSRIQQLQLIGLAGGAVVVIAILGAAYLAFRRLTESDGTGGTGGSGGVEPPEPP